LKQHIRELMLYGARGLASFIFANGGAPRRPLLGRLLLGKEYTYVQVSSIRHIARTSMLTMSVLPAADLGVTGNVPWLRLILGRFAFWLARPVSFMFWGVLFGRPLPIYLGTIKRTVLLVWIQRGRPFSPRPELRDPRKHTALAGLFVFLYSVCRSVDHLSTGYAHETTAPDFWV
jgi:hypothetical protein